LSSPSSHHNLGTYDTAIFNMKTTLILLASIASSMAQGNPDNKPTTTTPASAASPFYTTATLADGVVTVVEMPFSDGFYTTTVMAVSTGSFYTTVTLANGAVTVIPMPYSDGFYTTTESAVFTGPSPTALSTNSTKTPSTTSSAPIQTYEGAAAPLRAGGLLEGGVIAALGAAAYLL
jgi:hypothetical protein